MKIRKKNKLKQIIAMLLAVALVLSSVGTAPLEVQAETVVQTTSYTYDATMNSIGGSYVSEVHVSGGSGGYLNQNSMWAAITPAATSAYWQGWNDYSIIGTVYVGSTAYTNCKVGVRPIVDPVTAGGPASLKIVLLDSGYNVIDESSTITVTAGTTASKSVSLSYEVSSGTNYVNPISVSANDLVKTLGDPINSLHTWNDGVSARWGYTTSKIISNAYMTGGNLTNGKITDNTLASGTDTQLSTDGTTFDLIGWNEHNYTIQDSHSLDATNYPGDNTFVNTSRKIIVKSADAANLSIVYGAGAVDADGLSIAGNAYNGEWTNQPLELKAAHTDLGNYDTTIGKESPVGSGSWSEIGFATGNSYVVPGYQTESPNTDGEDISAQLLGVGNHAIELSDRSTAQNVKIDVTDPVPSAMYTAGTGFTDTSSDALSGLDSSKSKIAMVGTGVTPAVGDYVEFADIDVTVPGYYDVYVWAYDNAGNDAQVKVMDNMLIQSSETPNIKGETATENDLASDTWVNEDVTVGVFCQDDLGVELISGDHKIKISDNAGTAGLPITSANDHDPVEFTYTGETAGTTVSGTLVNDTDQPLSGTATYVVKIDKTKPVGDLTYNAGTPDYGFTDTSTDTASLVANSGVDGSQTVVAVAPYDATSTAPATSSYMPVTGAEVPNDGAYYDVWVIATDEAGNESVPVKALEHISYDGLDEIEAIDFAYDIASGSAGLNGDMAKMLSHVEAIYEGGSLIPLQNIDVDAAELAAIKGAIDSGLTGTTWPLTFETQGANSNSVTIQVTLYDNGSNPTPSPTPGPNPNPGPDPVGQELIYGNDFVYGISSGAISDGIAKQYTNVAAKELDGSAMDLSVVSVDQAELQVINDAIAAGDKSGNPFDLTFTTPDGTATTVSVTLMDNGPGTIPNPGEELIAADDFEFGMDQGALAEDVAKFLSNVQAVDGNGTDISDSLLSVDAAELQAINDAVAAGQKGTVWPLTFATPGGTETTVQVTLKQHSNPPAAGNEYITGNDFFYGLNQSALGDDLAKLYASVSATNTDGTEMDLANVSVDPIELQAINDAIAAGDKSGNPFSLTFTTSLGESATVQVRLYDVADGPDAPATDTDRLAANDFCYGVDQINISDAMSKVLAEVAAEYVGGILMPLADVAVDASQLDAINAAIDSDTVGQFPLTFATPDGTNVTITVTLKDHGNPDLDPGTPVISGDQITANDFSYGVDEADIDDDIAKLLSYVEAEDAAGLPVALSDITVDPDELAAINANKAAGVLGDNPLTFTTTDGTSVTIVVTLRSHGAGTVVPSSGTEHIVGNDFSYGVDHGAFDAEDAKQYASVDAQDANGFPIDLSSVTTDAAELQDINDAITAGELGEYPLTFYSPDGTAVTVDVTLKDNGGGSVDPSAPANNTERIAGNGFIYGVDEGSLSDTEAKFRSQVVAADVNGNPIDRNALVADAAELAEINDAIAAGQTGDFPLTYSTPAGTTATVIVTLKDHAVNPDQDPHDPNKTVSGNIGANDFIYGLNETMALDENEAKFRGRVVAKDMFGIDYDLSTISVNTSELDYINAIKAAGQTGQYPLTFTSPEGKSVTITVTVLNEVVPPVPGESSIGANDFNYGRNEGEMTPDTAKDLANAIAKNTTGENIPRAQIDVDSSQLAAINQAIEDGALGTYPLTFTEPDGKSVTIEVTVWDNVIHNPDPSNQQEIGGNDFEHDIQDGTINDDKAKDLANVYAKDQLGVDIPADQIHVNAGDLDKINQAVRDGKTGEFELRFTTDDGQELSVKVTLFNSKEDKGTIKTTTQTKKIVRKTVRTGDLSNVLLWLSLLAAAVIAFVGVIIYKKRQTQQ